MSHIYVLIHCCSSGRDTHHTSLLWQMFPAIHPVAAHKLWLDLKMFRFLKYKNVLFFFISETYSGFRQLIRHLLMKLTDFEIELRFGNNSRFFP